MGPASCQMLGIIIPVVQRGTLKPQNKNKFQYLNQSLFDHTRLPQ